MDNVLTYIEKRVNDPLKTLPMEKLEIFKEYIMDEELLIPLLNEDTASDLETVRQRVEILIKDKGAKGIKRGKGKRR